MALRAAIFLDKDGTLIEDVPFNADLAQIRLTPQAASGLAVLKSLGFLLLVVSNQRGIALGRLTATQVLQSYAQIQHLLQQASGPPHPQLDGFYFCPHAPDTAANTAANTAMPCACRKPAPGMLLRAARQHRLRLAASWMIGDILDDIEAGRRAGCRTVLIANGNETEWRHGPLRTPDLIVSNLHDAALLIAQHRMVPGVLTDGSRGAACLT